MVLPWWKETASVGRGTTAAGANDREPAKVAEPDASQGSALARREGVTAGIQGVLVAGVALAGVAVLGDRLAADDREPAYGAIATAAEYLLLAGVEVVGASLQDVLVPDAGGRGLGHGRWWCWRGRRGDLAPLVVAAGAECLASPCRHGVGAKWGVVVARVLWVVEPVEEELGPVVVALLWVEVPELVVLLVDLGHGCFLRLSCEVELDPGLSAALVVECWLALWAIPLDLFSASIVGWVALWQRWVEGLGAWKGGVVTQATTAVVGERQLAHCDGWWVVRDVRGGCSCVVTVLQHSEGGLR